MREFKPIVWYNETGDTLEIKWDGVAPVAQWINHKLTLLRSPEDREEIIGVQITGFRQYFLHAGVKLDPEYDEVPPLTPEEEAEMEEHMKKIFGDDFTWSETKTVG